MLSVRVKRFWERVRQGLTILRDRGRYFREVWLVQLAAWGFRFTAFWFLLEAFGVGGSVKNVLLVLGVNAVSALVPFTPQGAGVQQALLAKVFADTASRRHVAAYSVGQQVAIGALHLRHRLPGACCSSSACAPSRRSSARARGAEDARRTADGEARRRRSAPAGESALAVSRRSPRAPRARG